MGRRQFPPQAAELANVDHSAHGVHHAAGPEEQEGLEKCVREQVEHAGGHAELAAGAQGQEHVAELADGRVGQDPLQVGLRQGDQRGQQGREAADRGNRFLGVGAAAYSGVQRATR